MGQEIVWAEDNPLDQELIRECLRPDEDPPVHFVDDGVKLLAALQHRAPCLVVLDLKMPRLNGIEALQEIRGQVHTKDLPVVVFTSSSRGADQEACRRLGVARFVQKPLGFNAFLAAIRTIMEEARPRIILAPESP